MLSNNNCSAILNFYFDDFWVFSGRTRIMSLLLTPQVTSLCCIVSLFHLDFIFKVMHTHSAPVDDNVLCTEICA